MKRFITGLSFVLALLPVSIPAADANSVTLGQCFSETLSNSFELRQLRKDVERAAGTKLVIRARELSSLSLQTEAGIRGGALYGGTGDYAYFTGEFTQPVFNTGMASSWHRGQTEILIAQQKLNLVVCDRFQELRLDYLQAQRLEQLISVYEEIIARLQKNVSAEQQRRDVGTTDARPLLQSKVRLLSAQSELTGFRRDEYEACLKLAEIMGRSVDDLPRPTGELSRETVHIDPAMLTRAAFRRRADLQNLRLLSQAAAQDRRVVQAGYFPFVSLVGSGLYLPGKSLVNQATPIIFGQVPLGTEGRFGGSLSWQVIDNGLVTGPSRTLDAVRQEYDLTLSAIEENIPRELARISHTLDNSSAKLAALNKSAAVADDNLRLIENQISVGQATQLDFSDSERDLLAVHREIVDALYDQNAALAELDWVTGSYLEFAMPKTAP